MERIVFDEMGMHICFRVNDDKTVELTDFSAVSGSQELRPIPPFIFGYRDVHGLISVQIDGESSNGMNTSIMQAVKTGNCCTRAIRFPPVQTESCLR